MADVTFNDPPFYDHFNNFVAFGSDGQLYYVDEDVYAAELEQGLAELEDREAWIEEGGRNADVLEHRLGRELTGKERQVIADDMASGRHVDAFDSYAANFPDDRTSDDDDRQELMAEYAQEAWENGQAEEPDDTTTDQEVD